jgi:phosphoribosylaminoimidazole carboxylase (NCAIR synthetase)
MEEREQPSFRPSSTQEGKRRITFTIKHLRTENSPQKTMSAFTSSAPIVTAEDETVEREALTGDERQTVRDEVYGTEVIMPETETMLTEGTALMAQALQAIPDTDKLAYLEALERAPELVQRESDPAAFLRCEKYDYWAAAHRLVKYWNVRKMVFGSERAFLPMTQTGAMLEDMVYLQKGLSLVLADDKFGRSVVYWDRIRSTSIVIPRDSLSRCYFYLLQAISERASTQKKGFIMIINFRVSRVSCTLKLTKRLSDPRLLFLSIGV